MYHVKLQEHLKIERIFNCKNIKKQIQQLQLENNMMKSMEIPKNLEQN
jgi:hypothetical protein